MGETHLYRYVKHLNLLGEKQKLEYKNIYLETRASATGAEEIAPSEQPVRSTHPPTHPMHKTHIQNKYEKQVHVILKINISEPTLC